MSSRRGRRMLLNVIGLVVIVLFAFPFYWMLSTAFKQPAEWRRPHVPYPSLGNL
jgi:ABC-type glycerol-3-phosphate transport system permease component